MPPRFRTLLLIALIVAAVSALGWQPALATTIGSVAVTPAVVPVPASGSQKTAVLVTAAVSGVASGATVPCTVTLSLEPSNTVIAVSPSLTTSPAPASGTTSVTAQMLVPGGTTAGAAQATVTCGASTGSASFRITSLVGISVAPQNVPAGGAAGVAIMIASAGSLPATPCTLVVTAPPGAAPPLAVQAVSVSGGNSTEPATALVNLTLPETAALGPANASVSCAITGVSGSPGDSADFTITDPSVVTVAGLTTPGFSGGSITVTSVTLPGFSCVALLSPLAGGRITSAPATAGSTGVASDVLNLPAAVQAGPATLAVTCNDPTNPGNTASSLGQTITIVGSPVPVSSACTGSTGAGQALAAKPAAGVGGPYTGSAGDPVQFSGFGTAPSAGAALTTCLWDFGDGSQASALNPTHVYAAPGTYTVSLTVSDSAGLSATSTTTAEITPFLPLCSQPSLTGVVGLAPCLTTGACGATSLPGACLPACETLTAAVTPDGSVCPQPHIVVQASAGGPYLGQPGQNLTFQGSAGASGTRRLCAADATLGSGGPYCNLAPAVNLPDPVTYLWDFGDGTPATGETAAHAYCAPGNYRVTLTVQFDDGSIAVGVAQAQIVSIPPSSTGDAGTPSASAACDQSSGLGSRETVASRWSTSANW